jgi:hypothetical protein
VNGSRHHARRSTLFLVAYSVCLVLVLSFICFEVLDLDGSDFPVQPNPTTVKLVEPADHFRRTAHVPRESGVLAVSVDPALDRFTPVEPDITLRPAIPAPSPRYRVTLARASLDDPVA